MDAYKRVLMTQDSERREESLAHNLDYIFYVSLVRGQDVRAWLLGGRAKKA